MLNQSRVVNTLPFPERDTEVLQNSSCVATLVEHGVFILLYSPPPPTPPTHTHFFFLLDGVQQIMQKKVESMRVWVRWLGFESVVDGRLILCMCESARVCSRELAISTAPYLLLSQSTLLSLSRSLHFREGFYLSSTETLSSLHSERRKSISAPHLLLCLLLYTAGRQSDAVWEGCELLLKHKAVHSYLLYLVVAY